MNNIPTMMNNNNTNYINDCSNDNCISQHHHNHFNDTYANNDHMDNGNGTLNGTNRQMALCCRNRDDNSIQNHNDYELNKLYSNSSQLLDTGSCESHMQYQMPDFATPFNEFSLHYKSLRVEHETLKTQNAILREELEKVQKVDRIVMIERELEQARVAHRQLADSAKRMERQANDIIALLKSPMHNNIKFEELQFKNKQQENDIEKLKSHIVKQKEHIDILESAYQEQARRCKESHIPRERLHHLLSSLDQDKTQVQSNIGRQQYSYSSNDDTQILLNETISINHNRPFLSVKDSVMNSEYGLNDRISSSSNVIDQTRVDNITSSLSKINLSTTNESNGSSTNVGDHSISSGINQNKKILPLGLNRASSSLVQSSAPTTLGTTNSFPNLDQNSILFPLLSDKTLQNDR